MNKETRYIIKTFESTLTGQPWFGRSVYALIADIDESKIHTRPNTESHSLIELLWHMNTWAEFTLGALENRTVEDLKDIEANDWRQINPEIHTWKKGIEQLKAMHENIIKILTKKTDDNFLKAIVPNREYNFRFLLNGLIQHNIYHAGQMAYLKKIFD
jgi:uncharacterized damage-inducible protein DinB